MIKFSKKAIAAFFIIYFGIVSAVAGQDKKNNKFLKKLHLGIEVQWYPAGWLIGPAVMYSYSSKHIFFTKLGVNIADRHNWSGINDNEEGIGYGISLGYRYLFSTKPGTFFIGTRGELYNTIIDWKNDIGLISQTNGSTRIIIYQPSIEIGYLIKTSNKKWSAVVSAGVGAEINIVTKGKPVGQGGMYLASIAAYRTLN